MTYYFQYNFKKGEYTLVAAFKTLRLLLCDEIIQSKDWWKEDLNTSTEYITFSDNLRNIKSKDIFFIVRRTGEQDLYIIKDTKEPQNWVRLTEEYRKNNTMLCDNPDYNRLTSV